MGYIADQIKRIKETLPENVNLVAVSKTKPEEAIVEAYGAGQRIFGENKAQELKTKYENLPKDIQWHFIGHLQTNKIKYIAPFVSLIHAVDSMKLLKAINKEAKKNNRVIDCLLQFYVAEEDTKWGMDLSDAREILQSEEFIVLENVRIVGVMGMATYTDDEDQIKKEFSEIKKGFGVLKAVFFQDKSWFKELSMGMSHDYNIAIEEGSTLVRIGTTIFGNR